LHCFVKMSRMPNLHTFNIVTMWEVCGRFFVMCMKLRQLATSCSFEGDFSPSKCKKEMTCLCTSTRWRPLRTNYIPSNITDEDVYMVLFMSLLPSFDNLVTSLESMSKKNVDLQFIVARLLHKVSKRKECESSETTALVNKTHKSNEKLCFYCKKHGHFVRNYLKKKNDGKKKPIKLVKITNKCLLPH
jgi:hypothetical protein